MSEDEGKKNPEGAALETEQQTMLNVFEDPQAVIAAVVAIEGEAWRKIDSKGGDETLTQALSVLSEKRTRQLPNAGHERDILLGTSFYGASGLHRYKIRRNGQVVFDQRFSDEDPALLKKVRALGFSLMNE